MSGIDVLTFGCRLNAFESEVMRGHAEAARRGETIIVNTCAVTAEAERQARQAIRRAHRERPGVPIVVTGCAAQIAPDAWAGLPGVARVLGNAEKLEAASWASEAPRLVTDIMQARRTAAHLIEGFGERARAFIEIQQGCDHRCTFCIIPFGRGPSRSVPLGAVAAQARALAARGYAELVLTGVDLTSYGADLPGAPKLGQMVRRLLAAVPELPRLRLSSIDPAEIDADLWRAIEAEPRLMPHLHLSVQAGNDLVLKRMKRRHSRAQVIAAAARARALRPDIAIGADLIAGFPTEDEAMFADTLALVEDAGLDFLHVFPYSARAGTPAARMPQVAVPVRRERAARLRAAGAAAAARRYASLVGAEVSVLMERENFGRSAQFCPVTLAGAAAPGAIVSARVTAAEAGGLRAAALEGA